MIATISGCAVDLGSRTRISANDLGPLLASAIGAKTPAGYYYLPRENRKNGVTGDGNYQFDLRKCSDFILTAMPNANTRTEAELNAHYEKVNLYGEHSPEQVEARRVERQYMDELVSIEVPRWAIAVFREGISYLNMGRRGRDWPQEHRELAKQLKSVDELNRNRPGRTGGTA